MKSNKKMLIVITALELFATNGYYNTNVKTISGKLNMADGLIYSYFRSKKEILNAVIENSINNVIEEFNPLDIDVTKTCPEEICFKALSSFESNPNFLKLCFQVLFNQKEFKDSYLLINSRIDKPFLNTIKKYSRYYLSKDSLNQSYLLFSLINGMFYSYLFKEKAAEKDTILHNIKNIRSFFNQNK